MANYSIDKLTEITDRIELSTIKLHVKISSEQDYEKKRDLMRIVILVQEHRESIMKCINRLKSSINLTAKQVELANDTYDRFIPYLEYRLKDIEDPFLNEE